MSGDGAERRVRIELFRSAFEASPPALAWTGDGIRRDRRGQAHFVRHAIALGSRVAADRIVEADLPKMLVIEPLRSQSRTAFRAWLAEHGGPDAARPLSHGLADVERSLVAGGQLVFAYEPNARRTRLLWPDATSIDVGAITFMHAVWRCFFDVPDQPSLRGELLRWLAR